MKPALSCVLFIVPLIGLAGCSDSSTADGANGSAVNSASGTDDAGQISAQGDAPTNPEGDVSESSAETVDAQTDNLPGRHDASASADAAAPTDAASSSAPDAGEPTPEHFSFFVTSLEAMQELSGSLDGFGGNLGGLEGADEICQTIAGTVDGGGKVWRAFLSVTAGADGQPVHAIDRIGEGPWYDRNGRLVALSKEDLLTERPTGADPQIAEDLPNEFGQGQKQFGDNHDTLTGSNASGMLHSTDPLSTCMDWKCPGNTFCPEAITFEKMVMGGHSWPREDHGGGGGGQLADQQSSACAGFQEGDACTVSLGQGQVQSACVLDDATGDLLCSVPVPPPWFFACSNASVGDTCNVDKGPQKFDGTCEALEDVTSLACVPEGFDPAAGLGGGGAQDPSNWIAAHTVPGCNAGIELEQTGGGQGTLTVGGAGGYGGLYCFALTP
ncbi:MAG: hypothetical protein ACPGU1_00245 [Myxococcota bacterium]